MVDRHSASLGETARQHAITGAGAPGRLRSARYSAVSRGVSPRAPRGPPHRELRTALAAGCSPAAPEASSPRFEDLDTATARREHEDGQRRDLERLGFDWDGEPVRQSERMDRYEDALSDLGAGLTYRCWCSRRRSGAVSAPHTAQALPRHMSFDSRRRRSPSGGIGRRPSACEPNSHR